MLFMNATLPFSFEQMFLQEDTYIFGLQQKHARERSKKYKDIKYASTSQQKHSVTCHLSLKHQNLSPEAVKAEDQTRPNVVSATSSIQQAMEE